MKSRLHNSQLRGYDTKYTQADAHCGWRCPSFTMLRIGNPSQVNSQDDDTRGRWMRNAFFYGSQKDIKGDCFPAEFDKKKIINNPNNPILQSKARQSNNHKTSLKVSSSSLISHFPPIESIP